MTRDELQRQIWPSDTFVDFDCGLNNAVKRLREALGDTAESPRYIETLPKRGYRFIGTLRTHDPTGSEVAGRRPRGHRAAHRAPPEDRGRGNRPGGGCRWDRPDVLFAGVGHRVSRPPATPVERPTIDSLAVIPLTNLSSDPAQEYLCDAITDALITEVAQLRAIRVISRTSVMRYKKTTEACRTSPVSSTSMASSKGQCSARMIGSGSPCSSSTRPTNTSGAVCTSGIERRICPRTGGDHRDRPQGPGRNQYQAGSPPPQPRSVNVQALDAYLQGNAHLDRVGRGSGDKEKKKAAPFFQRAIELDPTFVQAYRGFINAHCYHLFPSSDEDAAIIANARQRIAELDPRSQDGWDGPCRQEQRDKSLSEEQQYRACIARNPNDSPAHREFAAYLDGLGRLDEGWKEQEIAQQLDPHPDRMAPNLYLPDALVRRGRHDEAIELLLRIVESQPYEFWSHRMLADIYEAKGMNREEIEELGWMAASVRAPGYSASSQPIIRSVWISRRSQTLGSRTRPARGGRAIRFARLSGVYLPPARRSATRYKLLEDAYILRNTRPPGCGNDPDVTVDLKGMRNDPQFSSDPRFLDLLRRIGFPQ